MMRFVGTAAMMVALAGGSAYGQTVPATQPAAPVVREGPAPGARWYLGVLSGAQVVSRTAPIVGGEWGIRIKKNVQIAVEGGWFGNVVTDSRVAEVNSLAAYIQQTQGLPTTGDIDAPAWFGTLGLRYVPENAHRVRPYLVGSVGLAKVEYRPTFILNGRNVTTNVGQYGVTMGRDLLGPGTHLAYGGGAGLIVGHRSYLDAGFRLTRINTPDHATNVRRISISIGRRF